jgi:hypothetical protein
MAAPIALDTADPISTAGCTARAEVLADGQDVSLSPTGIEAATSSRVKLEARLAERAQQAPCVAFVAGRMRSPGEV